MREEAGKMACDIAGPVRRMAARALLGKEWRAHRWRFLLGTFVLSLTLAGLLRAQLIPYREAALLVYWPVGILMTILLAMGSVAAEKADHTWEFLVARPVSRAVILRAKWKLGVLELAGMLAIATVCGVLAMWSRGFYEYHALWGDDLRKNSDSYSRWLIERLGDHPGVWICQVGVVSVAALACWYTALFLVLSRARHEFEAGLAGILLTILLHVWLLVVIVIANSPHELGSFYPHWMVLTAMAAGPLTPLSLLLMPFEMSAPGCWPLYLVLNLGLWVGLPIWLLGRVARRPARR